MLQCWNAHGEESYGMDTTPSVARLSVIANCVNATCHDHPRIAVVGATGSGKTTLARRISAHLQIPHVELDALHWDRDWTPAPLEVFRARVADALSGDAWVVDGNYSKVRDVVWSRADTIVWLDYPLPLILWRLARRLWQRTMTQEELWNGNRERLRDHLLSRDSLFLWALKTYRRRRKEYPVLFKQAEFSHLYVVHLRSPREANAWLRSLSASRVVR
jgi:adenylate kinase family enzyme